MARTVTTNKMIECDISSILEGCMSFSGKYGDEAQASVARGLSNILALKGADFFTRQKYNATIEDIATFAMRFDQGLVKFNRGLQ